MDSLSSKRTMLIVLTILVFVSLFFPFFSGYDNYEIACNYNFFDSISDMDFTEILDISLFEIVHISYAYQGMQPYAYYESEIEAMKLNLFFSCLIILIAIIQVFVAFAICNPDKKTDPAGISRGLKYSSLSMILFLWFLQLKMAGFAELSVGYNWGYGFFGCCILNIALSRVAKSFSEHYACYIADINEDTNQADQSEGRNPKQPPSSTQWACICGRTHEHYVSSCSCGCNRRDITSNK